MSVKTLSKTGLKAVSENDPSCGNAPFLSVRALSKNFGQFLALNAVDLDVMPGEFICFLGPSGCGKTTLLRAIAGLDQQTSGQVIIAGIDVSHALPSARDFGIVFQSYALFPNLTIAQNVGYGLVNQKLTREKIALRVAELLELVGLSEQTSKYPVQLSGGQQQRVALARALATSPKLLLLDEPLSALDARVRLRLREEIRGLQRRLGVTTIMVTHDQEEALSMADRIVVINNGVVEQVGTPEEIYNQPRTAFVADFVGRLTMMSGVVTSKNSVRIGDVVLDCSVVETISIGQAVDVALRPEAVQLSSNPKKAKNQVKALVHELEFLGSYSRATLRIGGEAGASFLADFSANIMREQKITKAQMLSVVLPQEALRVFPASHGPT